MSNELLGLCIKETELFDWTLKILYNVFYLLSFVCHCWVLTSIFFTAGKREWPVRPFFWKFLSTRRNEDFLSFFSDLWLILRLHFGPFWIFINKNNLAIVLLIACTSLQWPVTNLNIHLFPTPNYMAPDEFSVSW